MNIILKNIQSIERAEYFLPQKGLVKISGGNSNGKSILVKTLHGITTLSILETEVRRALIRDDKDVGMILIEHNNKVLGIKLHEERNQCVVTLRREDGTTISRTFREGGIEDLIYEIGFRTYNKNQICLQIHETFGVMPFVNTSSLVGGEITESITEDTVAKDFLTKYRDITQKKAVKLVASLNGKINMLETAKKAVTLFDYKKYDLFASETESLLHILEYLYPIDLSNLDVPLKMELYEVPELELQPLQIPPNIESIDIIQPALDKLRLVDLVLFGDDIESMDDILQNLDSLNKGICPVCGKLFIE